WRSLFEGLALTSNRKLASHARRKKVHLCCTRLFHHERPHVCSPRGIHRCSRQVQILLLLSIQSRDDPAPPYLHQEIGFHQKPIVQTFATSTITLAKNHQHQVYLLHHTLLPE